MHLQIVKVEMMSVKDIEWLSDEFAPSPTLHSQVCKKLHKLSYRMNRATCFSSEENTWFFEADVIDTFRSILRTDRNMLAKFRRW